ncbi:MAG: histone deacetylase [Thermoguttaceae bacterium]
MLDSEGVRSRSTRRRFLSTAAAAAAVLTRTPALLAGRQPAEVARQPTALVYDDIENVHAPAAGGPECPQRYKAIMAAIAASSCFSTLRPYKPRPATDDEIRFCHAESYLLKARREIESGAGKLSSGDTYVCRRSLEAAYAASGAACVGIRAVVDGQAKNAFCPLRPPGHHATADRGMGFCIFNNAAVAARYAQRRHGVGKLLIIDWDVHHGNGTQDIFYEDGSVFYFSTHQSPWYPWTGRRDETGRGKGLGTTMNWPLLRGAGRNDFLPAFHALAAAMDRYRPELVIISAGFDARHGDPLGRLELTDDDFAELTGLALEIARVHARGRLVSILEGGYDLGGLASAAAMHCGTLARAGNAAVSVG